MAITVAERANINDNIVNAARLIGRSRDRRAVFEAIYYGKQQWKTVVEIARRTGLSRKRVLDEGKKIVDHHFAAQSKKDGVTAYSKDSGLNQHKAKIFAAAGNKAKIAKIPTRVTPHIAGGTSHRITLLKSNPQPKAITVDDVASFRDVRPVVNLDPQLRLSTFREERIKLAFQRIIGEGQKFKDWGGEKNDLHTTKLRLKASRVTAAFAFKGRATTGTLTPAKMGKNGDQVGRLLTSEAVAFFIVYHGKVDQSIHEQMRAYALAGSLGGRSIQYGVIDGDDLNRLCQAYPGAFRDRP